MINALRSLWDYFASSFYFGHLDEQAIASRNMKDMNRPFTIWQVLLVCCASFAIVFTGYLAYEELINPNDLSCVRFASDGSQENLRGKDCESF